MDLKKLVCVCGMSYLLFACGATQQSAKQVKSNNTPTIEQNTTEQDKDELKLIADRFAQNADIYERNLSLLQLADNYAQTQDCQSANIIVKNTQYAITSQSNKAFANLLKAECMLNAFYNFDSFVNKAPYLALITKWLNESQNLASSQMDTLLRSDRSWNSRIGIANAKLFAYEDQHALALQTLLALNDANELFTQAHIQDAVWQWYSVLDQQNRTRLSSQYPTLSAQKILFDIIEDDTINDSVRQRNLQQWLVNNPSSPIAVNLPKQLAEYLSSSHIEEQHIAVLLPLSGRLSSQGEAIKQGILSGYYQRVRSAAQANSEYKVDIEFIDTGSFPDLSEEITQESLAKFDSIVGPLLRSHIETVKRLSLPNTKQLVLNFLPNIDDELSNQFAMFSLSPEQEAQQLVYLMRKQKVSNPVLIVDNASITERMRDAFVQAWQDSKQDDNKTSSIQEIVFTDNKSMRIGITSSLDVLQSQKRIKQLSNLTEQNIISVTRNRRDVDAFVIFARPDDVELINPIIESSISLFTNEQTPVFATSYSYNHKQNKNTQRDLRNLVFTDMPWVLPEGRKTELSRTVDKLFNQPSSSFLRLFAFGHDALSLIDNLSKLSTFSHMKVSGLSGQMSINSDKQVTRELPFIVINQLDD